jgi:5'-nucleotidase
MLFRSSPQAFLWTTPNINLFAKKQMNPIKTAAFAALALASVSQVARAQYSLTFLHNNDGESRLTSYTDALPQFGGVARFATMLNETRDFYRAQNHGVVSIFAGDTFLAGAQFQASLDSGLPGSRTFYDALAISRMGYDVSVIGNHEFDFGPNVLAEFITGAQTTNPTTYLSANLNFASEAALQAHVAAGRIAPSKTVTVPTASGNKTIGIIGVTTDNLPFISSPGLVGVNPVAAAVNSQIASLKLSGVDHIVLAGHLQGLSTDNTLVSSLDGGIDLIIAGGGDELLHNVAATSPLTAYNASAPGSVVDTGFIGTEGRATLSGSLAGATNTYPLPSTVTDAAGRNIPIVTTGGNYGYLGRVTLNVDAGGAITIDNSSAPQRVADVSADATHGVTANATVLAESVAPVQTFVAGLAANKIGETSVQLLHGGSSTIRSRETNLGNFVADGILHAAQQRAASFGVDAPVIGLVNGGGIRANIAAGDISRKSTFDVSPFGNFVSVVEDVRAADLKLLLENAYSRTTDSNLADGINPSGSDGRFAQLAGMSVVYDVTRAGFAFDNAGNVTTPGERIRDLTIGNVPILQGGSWLIDPIAMTFDIATLGFSANGGDQWFRTTIGGTSTYLSQIYSFTNVGVTDQNALQGYVGFINGGNNAVDVSGFKPEYSVQQSFQGDRISAIPEPGTWMLVGLGLAFALLKCRTRRSA